LENIKGFSGVSAMTAANKTLAVPDAYLGLWRRSLLEQHGHPDNTSLVLWLQADHQHIDIRIPDSRPDFSACACLQDCSIVQLRWLATQQGFAGVTSVNSTVCQWQRELDFQPSTGVADIGNMVFASAHRLLETGIETSYFEVWEKIAGSELNTSAQQMQRVSSNGVSVTARLLKAGKHFAYIRPRCVNLPAASSVLAAIDKAEPNHKTLVSWLDFEISFGEIIDAAHGRINHSTLPFREGELLDFSSASSIHNRI
jgi:hypothetical protein